MEPTTWQIENPVLRAFAYIAPFLWAMVVLTALYTESSDRATWLIVMAFYAGLTYLTIKNAFAVRDRQGIAGGLRKTVFVASVVFIGVFILALVVAFSAGIWSVAV